MRDDDNDNDGSDSDEGRMVFSVKHQTSRQRVQEALNAGPYILVNPFMISSLLTHSIQHVPRISDFFQMSRSKKRIKGKVLFHGNFLQLFFLSCGMNITLQATVSKLVTPNSLCRHLLPVKKKYGARVAIGLYA